MIIIDEGIVERLVVTALKTGLNSWASEIEVTYPGEEPGQNRELYSVHLSGLNTDYRESPGGSRGGDTVTARALLLIETPDKHLREMGLYAMGTMVSRVRKVLLEASMAGDNHVVQATGAMSVREAEANEEAGRGRAKVMEVELLVERSSGETLATWTEQEET